MKRLLLTFGVIILTGCVNPYTYREDQKIVASFTTNKGVQDTQECILVAWQRTLVGYDVSSQKTGKYYSVLSGVDNADVYSDGDVTKIDFYSLRGSMDPWRGVKIRTEGIKSCL
ncbi:hypothetical protein [Serratia fonticola]